VRPPAQSWEICRADYARALADRSGLLLVARKGERAVGYAFLLLVPSGQMFDFGAHRGEVDALAVAPEARGSGVGTALLERARAELRARGCRYWTIGVMEANGGAAALYERVGFRPWLRELAAPLDP
jgi:ribosomal protein S18 acetylase RimI-like enzyme